MSVNYREGQMVHKGQVLAEIDARPYTAVYIQAEGQLERDMALLNNAKTDLKRYQMAYEQHAIPEQTVATQQATVGQDEGTVKLDEGNLDAAKVNVDYAKIVAPIDGRVGLRTVDPGNIVPANGTTGLLTITQLQPITVIFNMAEDYISEVATQMRAGHKLRVDALDRDDEHELAQGTLLTLDNQVDTTTGTVRVRATFTNRDLKLFPNEFVNARLLVRTLNNVNLIPTAAIQRNNDVAFVYVVDTTAKTVHSRDIKVATTDGETAAVTGVNPGETLVIDGFDKLNEGTKVSIRKQPASAPAPPNTEDTTPPSNQPAAQTQPSAQGAGNTQLNGSSAEPATATHFPAASRKAKMNPSRPFILRPIATSLLMAAILLVGIVAYKQLPVSALPEVDYPTMQVVTFYPGREPQRIGFRHHRAARAATRRSAGLESDAVDQF